VGVGLLLVWPPAGVDEGANLVWPTSAIAMKSASGRRCASEERTSGAASLDVRFRSIPHSPVFPFILLLNLLAMHVLEPNFFFLHDDDDQ
jgi:hypothetical protein